MKRTTPPIQIAIRARRRVSDGGRSAPEARSLAVDEDVPASRLFACLLLWRFCCRASPAPRGRGSQPCDLGLPRPFRCGACDCAGAPRRAGAGDDQGRLRGAAPARTAASPRWGRSWRWTAGPATPRPPRPYARSLVAALAPLLRRRDLVLFDERGTGRSDVVDCPALQRGWSRNRSPSASAPTSSARARRLHDRRSGRRPGGGPAGARARQDLLLRRLLRDPVRPGLRGPLPRLPAWPRSSTRPTRPTIPTTGRSACRPAMVCGSPAAARRIAPATPCAASRAWSIASIPLGARPRTCSTSSCRRGPWRRAPTSASTKATVASSPATRGAWTV